MITMTLRTKATFGDWLREKRLSLNLSQDELANRASLTRQHVWNAEPRGTGILR